MYMYLIYLLDDLLFSHFKLIIFELICLFSSFHLLNLDFSFSCYHILDFFLLFIFIMTNNQHQENEAFREHDVQKIQNLDFDFESVRVSIQRDKKFAQRDKKAACARFESFEFFSSSFSSSEKDESESSFSEKKSFQVTRRN